MARKNNESMFDFSAMAVETGRSLAVIRGKDSDFNIEKAANEAHFANMRASMIGVDARDTAEEIFDEFKARMDADIDELDDNIKTARKHLGEKEQELSDLVEKSAAEAGDTWWSNRKKLYYAALSLFDRSDATFERKARCMYERDTAEKQSGHREDHKLTAIDYHAWNIRAASKRKIVGVMSISACNKTRAPLAFADVDIEVPDELAGKVNAICKEIAALKNQILSWQDESQRLQREADPDKINREIAMFVKKAKNAARAEIGDTDHEKRVMSAANMLYQQRKGAAKAGVKAPKAD